MILDKIRLDMILICQNKAINHLIIEINNI